MSRRGNIRAAQPQAGRFRQQAARCRRLAQEAFDFEVIRRLFDLAKEFEEKVERSEVFWQSSATRGGRQGSTGAEAIAAKHCSKRVASITGRPRRERRPS